MRPAVEQQLAEVAIAYAQNRAKVGANMRAVRDLHREQEGFIDLKPYRERYLSGEVTDDPQSCIVWRGWLHAVDECQAWDDEKWPMDEDNAFRCMAILLDERKELNVEGGKIKNRLRLVGQKLLRAAQ